MAKKKEEKRFEITLYPGSGVTPIKYENCEIVEQSESRVQFTGKRKDTGVEGFVIYNGSYVATVTA